MHLGLDCWNIIDPSPRRRLLARVVSGPRHVPIAYREDLLSCTHTINVRQFVTQGILFANCEILRNCKPRREMPEQPSGMVDLVIAYN